MLLQKRFLAAALLLISLMGILPGNLPGKLPAHAQGDTPAPRLIPPSGPYAVGRTMVSWVDESREEIHTPEAGDFREVPVEIWYPAEPEPGAELGLYYEDELADLYAKAVGLDNGRLNTVLSNSYPDAPLASEASTYPVILFDPGFSAAARQYTIILEELASQGYIVFSPSHAYVSMVTYFPDGRVVTALDADHLMSLWAPRDVNFAEFEDMWVPDVRFVLDQIEALNENDPQGRFTGHLDTDHLGLVGHSQGARTISEVCYLDDRCDAAINLDGVRSASVDLGLDKPFMFISADYGVDSIATPIQYGMQALSSDFYVLMIPRTKHMAFADAAFWLPLIYDGEQPQGIEAAQIAVLDYRLYITSFFDKYVRGKDVPLLDGPSDAHPEVFFLSREEPIPSPTAGVEAQPASLGSVRGTIPVGGAEVWTYEGHAGETLDMMLRADKPAANANQEQREQYGLLDTTLAVRNPDGSLLFANDDEGLGTDSSVEGLALPVDGTYQIEARSWESQTGGDYTLVIQDAGQ